jgi:hypothetical protein
MTFRPSLLSGLYEKLTRNDRVQSADLIFVMAGRMDRKQYGLELFRAGVAPRLVLSIARFEVSKMRTLQLPGVDELTTVRDRTHPDERHFFMKLDESGVSIEKAKLAYWNTYGEALGLRQLLETEEARRVIVISTDVHLRRVALALTNVFRDKPVEFLYCPVPIRLSWKKERWWRRAEERRFVLHEMIKLTGYRLLLSTPHRVVCWIMRGAVQRRYSFKSNPPA